MSIETEGVQEGIWVVSSHVVATNKDRFGISDP